jgi:hypothetical protein
MTPEREAQQRALLDKIGVSQVRAEFEKIGQLMSEEDRKLRLAWLGEKDHEAEAFQREQASTASRAADAAVRAAAAAESANTRATIAIVIAIISIIATAIGILVSHHDALK